MTGPPVAGAAVVRAALALLLCAVAIPPAAEAVWPFSSPRAPERAPSAPAPEAESSSITAPEVARRAEEASKTLRDIEALLAPGPGVASIQERLPEIEKRLAAHTEVAERQLEGPSSATIDAMVTQWQALRAELTTYVNVLAERGTTLERSLTSLSRLRDTWRQARADVRASKAPDQVVARIDGVVSGIDALRTRVQQERAATLVLQDQVARFVARCDDMLVRIVAARTDIASRLVVRDGVPLWETGRLSAAVTELPGQVRQAMDRAAAELLQFVTQRRVRIYVGLVLAAALALLTQAARRTVRGMTAAVDERVIRALDHPLAAALLLVFLGTTLSPPRSRVPQALVEMLMVVPTLVVLRAGIDRRHAPALYWLAAPVVADIVRRLFSTVPLLEPEIFMLEALGVAVLLGWTLAYRRPRWLLVTPDTSSWNRLVPLAIGAALVAFVVALGAAVAGYVRLAIFIGSGILGSTYIGLVLYAGAKVAVALVAVSLRVRPLATLRIVARHRWLVERRARAAVRALAAGAWVVLVLRHFGLWSATVELTESVLTAEWRLGTLSVPVAGVVVFLITLASTFVISAIVRFVLREEIYPRVSPERALPYAISSLVHYTLLLAGFLLGLAALGVDLTKITIVAGALGVGVGFGLQGLVNNFVSGLVVLSERRINVGDAVQIGDVAGIVQQLGIRACTVRTWEGAEVIVPNASLVTEKVANWTLSDHLRRIDVPIGVAYGTAPEKITEILVGVARAHASVLTVPEPVVLFRGVGDSALRFELRAWTDVFDRWFLTQSELAVASYAALREAAIEVPFPQYDVRLRRA